MLRLYVPPPSVGEQLLMFMTNGQLYNRMIMPDRAGTGYRLIEGVVKMVDAVFTIILAPFGRTCKMAVGFSRIYSKWGYDCKIGQQKTVG